MNLETDLLKFGENEAKKRFELHIDQGTAFIEYIKTKDKIYLTHTEVPDNMTGHGVGTALVKRTLDWITQRDLTLVPLCPFVALYIKKHPEYKSLVLKGINIA